MSREIRALIKNLEHERDSIVQFTNEIDAQVASGALTRELGDQIIAQEFEGHDPRAHLQEINTNLAQARSLLTNTQSSRLDSAAPIAIVLVLVVAVVWNFGAITGLFTAGGETFYTVPIAQSITTSQSIPLDIVIPVTSVRVNGEFSGAGRAKIELMHGDAPYLVASFDSAQAGGGALTGMITDESIALGTNSTNETNTTPTETTVPSPTNSSNETPSTTTETPVVLTPGASEPAPSTTVVNTPDVPARSELLDTACVETCSLPRLAPPFTLRITTSGGVTVRIDDLVYGTTKDTNATNETTLTVIPPATIPAPVETTPPVTTPPQPATGTAQQGALCTNDSDCTSGVCTNDRYDGVLSASVCAPSRDAWCVANNELYTVNTVLGDSVCIAGASIQGTPDATWLVSGGKGRFAIQSREGTIIAAIDKYGTMMVRGAALFNTAAGTDGWIVKDADGNAQLSVDNAGALLGAGTLATRTTPQRTGSGDFVIRTAIGTDTAVITQHGAVTLSGDFLKMAQLP